MKAREKKALRLKLLEKKAVLKFAAFADVSQTAASLWLRGKCTSKNIEAKAIEFEKIIDSQQPINQ